MFLEILESSVNENNNWSYVWVPLKTKPHLSKSDTRRKMVRN